MSAGTAVETYLSGSEKDRAVRATLKEAMRRISAFDRATNTRGSHQAFQASLQVLQEMRDAVGGADSP